MNSFSISKKSLTRSSFSKRSRHLDAGYTACTNTTEQLGNTGAHSDVHEGGCRNHTTRRKQQAVSTKPHPPTVWGAHSEQRFPRRTFRNLGCRGRPCTSLSTADTCRRSRLEAVSHTSTCHSSGEGSSHNPMAGTNPRFCQRVTTATPAANTEPAPPTASSLPPSSRRRPPCAR